MVRERPGDIGTGDWFGILDELEPSGFRPVPFTVELI
jgi:hypothetical protein